ncbi:ankyrin repeat-containing domain protein [Bisporella sp. PMI_857]|nr:ankyrin repeat-containing domain protein [Bisporella sp. PMI_857]
MMLQVCFQYLDSCEMSESVAGRLEYGTSEREEEEEEEYDDDLDHRSVQCREDERKRHQIQDLRSTYPLMDYATQNLTYHIEKAEAAGLDVFDLLDSYFAPGYRAFDIWLLVQWIPYRRNNIQPLHIAAYLGLTAYAQYLITSGSSVNTRDGEGRAPLFYATDEGHIDIVSLLLSNGADPDSDDRVGYKPLHLAAQKNRIEITKMLLAAGVSPKTKKTRNSPGLYLEQLGSDLGETPLQYACSRGYIQILNQFIDYIDEEEACRCLHWTVHSHNPDASEAVEAILKTGKAPVDVLVDGVTALVHAANLMKPNLIRVLLRYGADPNLRVEKESRYYTASLDAEIKYRSESTDGHTAMHAFAGIRGSTSISGDKERGEECLKLLVDAGGDVNARTIGNHTPLHYAVENRHSIFGEWLGDKTEAIVTELLLQYGADPNARCNSGATPLHKVSPLRPKLVEILIRNGADVNAKNNNGTTPLLSIMNSVSRGWPDVKPEVAEQTIFKLLEHGADVEVEDDQGWTAFHHMFAGMEKFNSEKLWKAFMKAGADLNKPNKFGKPPLLSMKQNYHRGKLENEKLVQMLVEEGLHLSATDSANQTVLFSLFDTYDAKLAPVQKLLNFGCSAKARGKNGETLLHKCIKKDAPFEIFICLVNAGADPTAVDNDGNTILHEVALNHSGGCFSAKMKKLIDMGVPTDAPNKAGRTPLHIACAVAPKNYIADRAKELLDLLLDGRLCPVSNVCALDMLGASSMHYAASFSEFRVGYLLQAGAEPALKTPEGLTPLHIAARGRASNVIGLLLLDYRKRGILQRMINDTDHNGCTALHYACRSGRPESVRYLLSAGANIFARDKVGRAPLHALAEFPEENLLWVSAQKGDLPGDFDAACVTLGDLGRPCSSQHPTVRNSDPARTRDILEMLENAGADLQATWMVGGEERTPMDVAVWAKCTELVNELRNRGLPAKDSAAEALIPQPGGMKEAKALLGRVDPPSRGARHTSEDGRPSKKQHLVKFEEILKQRDYNLFDEFVKLGGDLLALGGEGRPFTGLHALVAWGHAGLLETYFEEAARVDDQEWMQEEQNPGTLLCHACVQALPRLDVIKVLVEKVKVDVNRISNRYGYIYKATALHWLAVGAHFWNIEAIGYLLDHGADVEARNARGETPLIVAVGSEHPNGFWKEEIMRVLLERGANPNALRDDGKTCLNMSDDASVTRLLLKHGADISVGKILPLTSAVEAMDVDAARLLLEAGADPNKDLPLYKAARPNDKKEVDPLWGQAQRKMILLLLKHGSNPFAPDDDGSSTLQKVIEEHGILDVFWELPNFPVELRGEGGRTPLISACYPITTPAPPYYHFDKPKPKRVSIPNAALTLIEKGADVTAKDNLGRTAFHWICTLPEELDEVHQNLVTTIINRSPGLIHERDSQGFKPFHIAAANSYTHIWITDYLISCGFDPKEPDPAGMNILHYLAPQLLGEKTKALAAAEHFKHAISLGLPVNHRNDLGETPIFRFIATSWKGTFGPSGSSYPTYAIENDISHVKALPIFLEAEADLQTRNAQEENLLHATAKRWRGNIYVEGDQQKDMLDIFKELIARGLDARAEDAKFRTAIDVAVASSNSFLVDLFGVKERGVVKKIEVSDAEDEEEGSECEDGIADNRH